MNAYNEESPNPRARRRLFVIGAAVLLGLLVAAPLLPSVKLREQVTEWDGMIQTDWKILGVIPYSSLKPDRTVKVTESFWKELAKAGIQPDAGFRKSKLSHCVRHLRLPGLDYFARTVYEANLAELERSYGSQLKKEPSSTRSELIFNSTSGLPRQVFILNLGPGTKPGLNKVDVMISFVVEPHVER